MGIGEGADYQLNEKGYLHPGSYHVLAPRSRMDILTDAEIDGIVGKSNSSVNTTRQ